LRGSADMPAMMGEPAHTESAFMGYDSTRHEWIYMMTASDGSYFMGSSNRMTLDAKWTQSGKPMSAHDVCMKQ